MCFFHRLDEIGFFRLDVKMSLESKNFDMMLDSSGMAIQLTESSAGSDELAFALLSSLCPMLGLREVKLRVHLLTVFWAVRGLSLIQTCPSLQKLQISKRRSSSTTSVSKDAISLSLEDVSDSDVGDLISALGEGKKIKELRLTGSLSTESVECILRTLQKQKCVGMVDLQVNTITLHIDAMRLHLLQILEMSQSYKYLCIDEKCDWNQLTNETDGDAEGLCSGLSVKKDFKDFSFSVRGRDGTTGATLPLASESDINFQEFLQNFLLGKEHDCEHVNAVIASMQSVPGLTLLVLVVCTMTVSWATESLSLIQTCPALKTLEIKDSFSSLSVEKDAISPGLNVIISTGFGSGETFEDIILMNPESTLYRISLWLPQSLVKSFGLKEFLQSCYFLQYPVETRKPEHDEHDDALMSSLHSVSGLREVHLTVNFLTATWAKRIISLIHSCPTLQKLHAGALGFLTKEGIHLLQTSSKHPNCTLIFSGRQCNKSSSPCCEPKDWELSCNEWVNITI